MQLHKVCSLTGLTGHVLTCSLLVVFAPVEGAVGPLPVELSCHVIVRTAYPFPWGSMEIIPALSQGEDWYWISRQLIALVSNVGFSISLKDTSTCGSALPGAGI